jgi:hypothetical protein
LGEFGYPIVEPGTSFESHVGLYVRSGLKSADPSLRDPGGGIESAFPPAAEIPPGTVEDAPPVAPTSIA